MPGLGFTGFLTAGLFTAGLIATGLFTAGGGGARFCTFAGARFLVAAFFATFLNTGFGARLVAGFTTARFLGAALMPLENIAGPTAGCGLTAAVATPPPAGTHADTVATQRTSDIIPVRSRAACVVPSREEPA